MLAVFAHSTHTGLVRGKGSFFVVISMTLPLKDHTQMASGDIKSKQIPFKLISMNES